VSNAKIFLLTDDALTLQAMAESSYVTEAELQLLLARYCDLLPGDQIDPEEPRRWLFVGREVGVPAGEGEGGWWSLDHLFIDQEAIPTFVECKLASDRRTRREVVAQMLDYAANGTEYWSTDRLRQLAAATAERDGRALDEAVVALIGSGAPDQVEGFWRQVQENLRRGKVRLLFVTDEAPRELRRMTEFLNEQMHETEVLLVEIRQFRGNGGQRVLVPRLIGHRERTRPSSGARTAITSASFMERCSPEARTFLEEVLRDAAENGYQIQWGSAGFSVRMRGSAGQPSTFAYALPQEFQFYFGKGMPLTEDEARALRHELLALGFFRESGERTLSARLDPQHLQQASAVWGMILRRIAALQGRP
jgi:hypothetical protein